MAALEPRIYNLTDGGEPEKLVGMRATGNLFEILGMRAIVGRSFSAADEDQGAPVVVVAERLWRQRFAADPGLVGRSLRLNGLAHTVVGVVPDDFRFPDREATLWVPAAFTPAELRSHGAHWYVVGRLAASATLAQARAEMAAIAQRMVEENPAANAGVSVSVTTLHEQLAGDSRPALRMLLGAVALVLLIACANVASLLFARGANRRKELAVRRALGADRARIFRQLFTESMLLGILGLALGVGLAVLSHAYLARLVPGGLPPAVSPTLDLRVLAATVLTAFAAVLLFGAWPAFTAARPDVNEALKSGGGRGASASIARVRHALVVAEVALTVVLLSAAGLLLRSYSEVTAVRPGFEPRNLLIAETNLPAAKYGTRTQRTAFYRQVLERVNQLPGVAAAGYVNYPPLTLKEGRGYLTLEGRDAPPFEARARQVVSWRVVSARYLQALGVPLLRGRHLDERDGAGVPPSVLVNEAMAQLHWADGDPVGQRLKLGREQSGNPWATIVGVVGDVHQMGLEVAAEPEVYFSLDQDSGSTPFFWPQHLVVRVVAEGDPLALAPALRGAVAAVDREQPLSNVRSMEQVIAAEMRNRGTQATLIGAFALLALFLSAAGLYAVLSFDVAQRSAEIAVRMALGAGRGAVLALVVRQALRPARVRSGARPRRHAGKRQLVASAPLRRRRRGPADALRRARRAGRRGAARERCAREPGRTRRSGRRAARRVTAR